MSQEEIKFLKNQVQRLNLLLARYQHSQESHVTKDLGDVPIEMPWLYERSFLSPIVDEYDKLIEDFRSQLNEERSQLREVKLQAERLIMENDRLTKQLKEQAKQGLQDVDIDRLKLTDEHLQDNLQDQLTEVLREKDATVELWQNALAEVDRLEAELRHKSQHPQALEMEEQAEQLRSQYVLTVDQLNAEINSLKDRCRQLQSELGQTREAKEELERCCADLQSADRMQQENLTRTQSDARNQSSRLQELESKCARLSQAMEEASRDLELSDRDRKSLERQQKEMETKYKALEEQTYQAMCQMKESIAMAENALLEKDQALMRERQKEEENENLQQAINKLVDEAGSRTREEVEMVRQQANQNIGKVLEELNTSEMARLEQVSETERAVRDKRRAEEELEKLHKDGLIQTKQDLSRIEELNARTLAMEREREEQRLHMDSMRAGHERDGLAWRNERSQLQAEVDKLRERVATLQQSYDRTTNDCQKYASLLDEAESRVQVARKEAERAERRLGQEVTLRDQESRVREQELQNRLNSSNDTQRRALAEMRQMLTSQSKVSTRWKNECHAITARFEEKLATMKEEMERQKRRNEELTTLLADARTTLEQRESAITEYTATIRRLSERKKLPARR